MRRPTLATLILSATQFHPLFGGSATVQLENSRNACTVVNLPPWAPAPLPAGSYPSEWREFIIENPHSFAFRALDGGVMVGFHADPARGVEIYSPSKYAIQLPGGRVRKATDNEWGNAETYPATGDWRSLAGNQTKPDFRVVLSGKEYSKTGAKWPPDARQAVRISADNRYVAIQSWDGVYFAGGDLSDIILGPRARIKGDFYVDIFDTSSGAVVALHGHFDNVDIFGLFFRSMWFANRYYVLPLDYERMNRLALCDLSRASESPPGGKR